ncbi:MurR/RpiR family transcriptional regulator [Peptostreptococcus faecalis]|uniref:MurR/RpiR family transcriptional regulator n=1 Tax=Peptostreptococcus faecalis TaxID=2045015 RepID=UPI000C7C8BA0|nr:MurR/RpiR family transcriptional regulator [Peptostreptococcus faecalis]
MSIIGNLKNPNFKVTKSDKMLIEYIVENIEKIPYMQIAHISCEVGIGDATITRFVKKVGSKNFQDFKIRLAEEIIVRKKNSILSKNIKKDEPAFETAAKLAASNIMIIEETLKCFDSNQIDAVSKEILSANKIYFIGIAFSGTVAMDSSYKFMRIGLDTCSHTIPHTMLMAAPIMKKGDMLIAISNSGEAKDIVNTIKIAKKNGVKVVSITSNECSTVSRYSDWSLNYYSDESYYETGSINSKLAQYFTVDLVYIEVLKKSLNESSRDNLRTIEAKKVLNIDK